MNDIQTIVKGISRLKPLPQAFHQIMTLAKDSQVEMERLADAVALDPILSANLLKDANSAYYGRSGSFETVHQAVVFLGTIEVLNLVLMAGCRDTLSVPQKGYALEAGELWQYSLASAMLARAVARYAMLEDAQLVFTVAMLKDIGKVVLAQYVSEQYHHIRSLVDSGRHSFREAEKLVLGIDHAELGALVATVWRFGPNLVDMIRYHHQPLQCKKKARETAAVYVGDLLCMMLGNGVGADGLAYRYQQPAVDLLGLSDVDMQQLLIEFESRMDDLKALMEGVPTAATGAH